MLNTNQEKVMEILFRAYIKDVNYSGHSACAPKIPGQYVAHPEQSLEIYQTLEELVCLGYVTHTQFGSAWGGKSYQGFVLSTKPMTWRYVSYMETLGL